MREIETNDKVVGQNEQTESTELNLVDEMIGELAGGLPPVTDNSKCYFQSC